MARHRRSFGIDFGTSTSLVAERLGGAAPSVLPVGDSTSWMPSLIGSVGDDVVFGEAADDLPADAVVRSIKRAITLNETEAVVPRTGRVLDADQLIAGLISELRERAARAGVSFDATSEIRLGCPAMWDGSQRLRLLGLAEKAGIPTDEGSLIDEPIAAGIGWVGYRYQRFGERKKGRLLVFDMGGGTLDIAVLDVWGGEHPEISVLSAVGSGTAGDALDAALYDDMLQQLSNMGHDLANADDGELAAALLMRSVRRAKVILSNRPSTSVRIGAPFTKIPAVPLAREHLESILDQQLRDADRLVLAALRQARLTQAQHADPSGLRRLDADSLAGDIDFVLVTGGMSQVPAIERRLGAMFPHAEVTADTGVAPAEAIVAGLSDNSSYERVNLHRPGFDFVLSWADPSGTPQEQLLYEAHTPFYEPYEAMTKSDLSYRFEVDPRRLPRAGTGQVRVRLSTGQDVSMVIDGEACDGIAVRFGHKPVVLKMSTSGRLTIVDGRGEVIGARVDAWPVIRGKGHNAFAIHRIRDDGFVAPRSWYLEKEYAPPTIR